MVPNKTKVMFVSMVILILSCGILPFSLDNKTPISLTQEPTPTNTAANANPVQETPSGNGEVDLNQKIASNNVTNLKEMARISIENPAKIVWFSDSSRMAVLSQNKLNILSAEDLVSKGSFEFSPPIFAIAFSPNGHTVASTSDQISLELREAVDGKVISTLHPSGQFLTFDFSPDGKYVLTGSVDNIAATIWDITSGQVVKELSGFETAAPIYNVTFAPDNRSLVWVSRAHIQFMDINSGKLGNRFEHEDFISDYAVSQDGQYLATAAGGTVNGEFVPLIRIWDVVSGNQVGLIQVSELPGGNALAFSADGKLLAAGIGSTIFTWNVPEADQLAEFQVGGERISSVSFSPDGNTIGSTSTDGVVIIWQAAP